MSSFPPFGFDGRVRLAQLPCSLGCNIPERARDGGRKCSTMMETGVMEVLIMDDSAVVRQRLIAMLSRIVNEEGISYAEDAATK